ncbi:nuclear transport factor 2 family protein, partial [Ornithinicoccus halotolerans]|uniref:nuclear transport factor 2 family protein n=1 Tax=Ornithinicoccus halotolerans TaxID=1748220 RepID=UPI0018863CD7
RQAELARDRAPAATALSPEQEALLEKYVAAFWEKDVDALAGMFTDAAVWEMPPFPEWYRGPADIARLIGTKCPGGRHDMVLLPTRANGQPAFGLYMRGEDGDLRPFHLQVLTLEGDRVGHVGAFFDQSLFERFGLPPMVRADDPAVPAAVTAGG